VVLPIYFVETAAGLTMPHGKMPSISLSQLRDTKRLKAWLRAGKTVELRERDRVIARIIPVFEEGQTKAISNISKNYKRSSRRRQA
jgi:antitoxin (DNA-binding transcriptional repressor) of toxin-antitoxin stability system